MAEAPPLGTLAHSDSGLYPKPLMKSLPIGDPDLPPWGHFPMDVCTGSFHTLPVHHSHTAVRPSVTLWRLCILCLFCGNLTDIIVFLIFKLKNYFIEQF